MNRGKINKLIKTTLLTVSVLPLFLGNIIANASDITEKEFLSVIEKYDKKDVVVENGVSLREGEKLDLSKYPNWDISNNDVVTIDKSGIVTAKNSGSVYLSKKIGDKVYVFEIYVPEDKVTKRQKNSVDRNYYKVFVDAGHGGNDNGAYGNGLYEDELNLKIALKIQKKLEAKGIEVKMSRTSDVYLSLKERAELANAYEPDVFISNHINSFTNEYTHGIETYYHTDKIKYKPLSEDIQNSSVKATGAFNRGVKAEDFAVIRETTMPSTLFEAGFITNKEEATKLNTDSYQEKLAQSIADGIEKYLKDNINLNGTAQKPENKPVATPPSTNKPTTNTKMGKVTASSLNVRSGASTKHSVIGSISKGETVEIVSTSNGWHKIKYKNGYGYVSADYVSINSSSSTNTNKPSTNAPSINKPTTNTKMGKVTASLLNVRSGASTQHSVIGSISNGETVAIASTSNGWHQIKYKSGYGYVSAEYVK